ncbi:hypothetical protein [Kribbella sp. VKM Ac-2569]|uniref:hypothetical protein n=1 Tax=Kribbella sp. VKM Ac-2569 TaxID=2512220 RepID=UPI00102B49DA|nr:hypothetical protein [Kribbella sp. VKM Ac-2569]
MSLLGGLVALVSGALPWSTSGCLVRVAPVLVFLVGATVIAELTDAAGVFDVLTRRAAEVIDELTYFSVVRRARQCGLGQRQDVRSGCAQRPRLSGHKRQCSVRRSPR